MMEKWREVTGETYPVDRFVNDVLFNWFRDKLLNDSYDNETFSLEEWIEDEDGYWNFWHKPSNLRIGWYKYPLRYGYSNMKITPEMLWAVILDCSNSIHQYIRHHIPNEHIFWKEVM